MQPTYRPKLNRQPLRRVSRQAASGNVGGATVRRRFGSLILSGEEIAGLRLLRSWRAAATRLHMVGSRTAAPPGRRLLKGAMPTRLSMEETDGR